MNTIYYYFNVGFSLGVPCTETEGGVQCGQCPEGVTGDASQRGCQRVERCDSNPCYPGVTCIDTTYGYTCGDCPEGMEGNGTLSGCVPSPIRCEHFPCFTAVACIDTEDGYQCGACPQGMTGNGTKFGCQPMECDINSCFPDVECVDTPEGFRCGSCPHGFKGNGTQCTDIDEVCSEGCKVHKILVLSKQDMANIHYTIIRSMICLFTSVGYTILVMR